MGLTIANGAITAGRKVYVFLSSAGIDLVQKRATDTTELKPLEPLVSLIRAFSERGGTLWTCTPCVKARATRRKIWWNAQ